MPDVQLTIQIPGIQISSSTETEAAIFLTGKVLVKPGLRCPFCKSDRLRTRAYNKRELKHALWMRKLVSLTLRVPKLVCRSCRAYSMAPIPGILPYKQATENFRQEVFHLHQGGITQTSLAKTHFVSTATVERWYHSFVAYRVAELSGRSCPRVLGIDEHFFSRKDGYATTLVDLRNHKVFDVVKGRSEEALKAYFKRLKGRDKVRVIVMDLSETYRSIARKYFPNAMIVADRFHVIRLLNQHFLKVWKDLDPIGSKSRGLLSLVRRHEWNLKPDQLPKMQKYFSEIQGFEPIYKFKQDLSTLLLQKRQTRKQALNLIPQILWHMNELLESPLAPLKTFGQTLQSWLEPIARMWRFTKNNGITEGLHTKMEMISRRAFGFRNFENYRLRVIALCGWDGVFTIRNHS